jgi:hypothetical protein
MKARNLRDLEINSSRVGGLVGDLMRKGTAYDVWALDPASSSSGGGSANTSAGASGDQDGLGGMISSSLPSATQIAGVGAEELNGLSVLLPRKRKGGKLYLGALCAFHAFCWLRSQKSYCILFSSKVHHAAPCSLCAPREAHKTRGCL